MTLDISKYEFPDVKPFDQNWKWFHKYPHDILTGVVPAGKLMRLAAERHFKDLERNELYVDEQAAKSVVAWFKFVPITDGKDAGRPTTLLPWQIWLVVSLIAWKWNENSFDDDGNPIHVVNERRYNQTFILVSRKAGKSTLAAGLMLYLMHKAGYQPRAYSLATKRDQAKIVLKTAQVMINLSPRLKSIFNARTNDIITDKHGEFKALASDSNGLDGLNPDVISLDECLISGTKISNKNIEDIVSGDVVDTYCELTKTITKGVVGDTYVNRFVGELIVVNNLIKSTPNHPYFVRGEWVDAEYLNIGDVLMQLDGSDVVVESIRHEPFEGDVYNFEVVGTHTYFANNVLMHNCHAIKDRNLYGVVVSAFGAKTEYLNIVITTAGFILDGLCTDLYKNGEAVLECRVEQDNYFYAMWQIDKEDDWSDPQCWYKSNPGTIYGLPSMRYLNDRYKEASLSFHEKANMLTKHLNLFVNGADKWLDMDKVQACAIDDLDFEKYKHKKCYIGFDRSLGGDVTSLYVLFPDDDGGITIFGFNIQTQAAVNESTDYLRKIYQKAESEGYIRLIDTATRIRNEHVKQLIRDVYNQLPLCEHIAYDPYKMKEVAMDLEEEGLPVLSVSQGAGNLSEPAKKFESLVEDQLLRYNGDTMFNFACECAVMDVTKFNNVAVYKTDYKTEKIDPLIAVIIALSSATLFSNNSSVYNHKGLTVI